MAEVDLQPAVDVLIPAFNAATTVERSVRSMCDQTYRNIRIIVVDDGSTDATPDILERMAADDPRILVVTTPNGGIVAALNTALEHSKAEFVARFDADDFAYPDRLVRQMDYIAANDDCVAVGCNVVNVDGAGERISGSGFTEKVRGDPFYVPATEPYLLHPFLLARRAALIETGGYRYVFHSEDADLYWRLASHGRLANVVDVLGEYRIHADSISAKAVVNGRISAVNSQLAALSERRRRNGVADLTFTQSALAGYLAADSLRGILDLAMAGLSRDEQRYLEVATAAKLLELSGYRAYRLTVDDLRTIRRLVEANFDTVSLMNRRQLVFKQMLKPNGRRTLREGLCLVPWKVLPRAVWELSVFMVGRRLHRPTRQAA